MLRPGSGHGSAALLVVPPFSGVDRPSLGLHLLQASARRVGFEVCVFYANLYLASIIGYRLYETISYAPTFWLLGERFFAEAAYGIPALSMEALSELRNREKLDVEIDVDALQVWAPRAGGLLDEIAAVIAAAGYPLIGFSSTFEQTAASIALINRIKSTQPSIVTLMGGANCEGPMAEGIGTLTDKVDYIFSGECEEALARFLVEWRAGHLPETRIVHGEAVFDMDTLARPDYQEYYDQLTAFLPEVAESGDVWLPYESSRGCWWGAKHHCTFCGLNAQTMAHRAKSSRVAFSDLGALLSKHPSRKVSMVDNIMPHEYFKTFLPFVKERLGDVHLFYEEKANLSLDQVLLLKSAGVNVIQPGIESLSTTVLRLMDKGVTARKNIDLLRFARSADLALNWNYLFGFPGDDERDYWNAVELIPCLAHLSPPSGLSGLSIDRFSPYFEHPARYGITDLEPMASYMDVLPPGADVFNVAYHFGGTYRSGSRESREVRAALGEAIDRWRALWKHDDRAVPALSVFPLIEDSFLLLDSRFDSADPSIEFIDHPRMRLVLTGEHGGDAEAFAWARERRYVIHVDGHWIPLATADPDTMLSAMSATRKTALRVLE